MAEAPLDLAPDRLHKSNMSGGSPHEVCLPDACTDGLFRAAAGMPFVEYLNCVFRRAGFPHDTGGGAREWEVTHKRGQDLLGYEPLVCGVDREELLLAWIVRHALTPHLAALFAPGRRNYPVKFDVARCR